MTTLDRILAGPPPEAGCYDRIVCADGQELSVQASPHHYVSPGRDDWDYLGPYDSVEVGIFTGDLEMGVEPSEKPAFDERVAEGGGALWGWLDPDLVRAYIERHGGYADATEHES